VAVKELGEKVLQIHLIAADAEFLADVETVTAAGR